jgi:hypothetical protein
MVDRLSGTISAGFAAAADTWCEQTGRQVGLLVEARALVEKGC